MSCAVAPTVSSPNLETRGGRMLAALLESEGRSAKVRVTVSLLDSLADVPSSREAPLARGASRYSLE